MDDLEIARAAAGAGGEVLRRWFLHTGEPHMKGDVDPVTEADREAEQVIVGIIAEHRPDDGIVAEEGGETGTTSGRNWVIDPLDGTVNFVHGVPHCGVSIALDDGEGGAVGVILDPFRSEEFWARRGEGAFLGDRPIRVSGRGSLSRALVSTGFAYDRRDRGSAYTDAVAAVLAEARGVRRLGSAALDLAWVACGRFDGHWEFGLHPWDLAAGAVLIREAGGWLSDSYGDRERPADVVATNGLIHEPLRRIVAHHRPEHFHREAPGRGRGGN
jgi:myo-inositol-1(or 4)-monophosphatase